MRPGKCILMLMLMLCCISLSHADVRPPATEKELHEALKKANPGYNGKATVNRGKDGKIWGINLNNCNISDLSPISGMELEAVTFVGNNISDITPLSGMKLKQFLCADNPIEDLAPVSGMPIWKLAINKTKITDISMLKEMPIQEIYINPGRITKGIEILRNMKTLSIVWVQLDKDEKDDKFTLQFKDSFWKLYDKGEYNKQ